MIENLLQRQPRPLWWMKLWLINRQFKRRKDEEDQLEVKHLHCQQGRRLRRSTWSWRIQWQSIHLRLGLGRRRSNLLRTRSEMMNQPPTNTQLHQQRRREVGQRKERLAHFPRMEKRTRKSSPR